MAKQEIIDQENATKAEVDAPSRPRKLTKEIEGNILTISEKETGATLTFDFSTLSADIQNKLGVYGLSQKLGDAAAGKSGQDAIDAITKVHEGLASGDWSVRAPAAPKVTKKDIAEKVSSMSAEEQAAANALLAKLGIKL
jgi:hypothetical protein